MTSCPEAMVLRIWRFWKTVIRELTLLHWSRQLQSRVDFERCRQTVGLSAIEADSWSWGPIMMLRSWGPTMILRNWDWTTRCAERWGVVSLVWFWKTFKNCLSPHVDEPKSEVNKCVRTWTTESPVYLFSSESPVYLTLPIVFCICTYTVIIDIVV